MATKTDPNPTVWAIDDEVIRLREWGTDLMYRIPARAGAMFDIGSGDDCAIRLIDNSGQVSAHHARVQRDEAGWSVHDLSSKNGLRLDGVRCAVVPLEPGIELGIGGLTLIAESRRLANLRSFVARILGWAGDRVATVDLALRGLRLAAARMMPLDLCGTGDLVPIALALHERTLGPGRPFIMCDPRRQSPDATVRTVKNVKPAVSALLAAQGGSLCLWGHRMPRDFIRACEQLRTERTRVQIIVCRQAPEGPAIEPTRISIPSLVERRRELPRIIDEYAADAIEALHAHVRFTSSDRAWIAEHSASSLPEIEKGTLRVVAMSSAKGNLHAAAAMLGMSPVALRAWLLRRDS